MASPGLARLFAALADYEPGPRLRGDLVGLARVRDRLDLIIAETANAFADSGEWEDDGYTTPIQWMREEARMTSTAACDAVAVGMQLGMVSRSAEAMERGEIGFAHLALIASSALFHRNGRFNEQLFLARAREQNVSQFRKTCEHVRHAQDRAGFVEDEAEAYELRYMELTTHENGSMSFRGWCPPEQASMVRSGLEPFARRSGRDDDRTRGQRLVDALVEGLTKDHTTELVVSCTLETLEGRLGAPAAETEWGALLSSQAVARLVCGGAAVRRMVLDADGVVIDFGRRRRLMSPHRASWR